MFLINIITTFISTILYLSEYTSALPVLANLTNTNLPVVLMHGILASKDNMVELKGLLESNYGLNVYNLEIGDGSSTSINTDMTTQLKILCDNIYNIDDLKDGFNFIGMSQGGLLGRGYVEYCNKYPVKNLITLASPNAGIYFNLKNNYYQPTKQKELSYSNYWRDPFAYSIYLTNSTYLAQLNQEIPLKSGQNTLDVVDNFVMCWSAIDDVIKPPESSKLSMYEVMDGKLTLVELFDTELYKNDFLKLKTMNESNRLHIYETDCLHSQHKELICFDKLKYIFEKFLL